MAFLTDYVSTKPWNNPYDSWTTWQTISLSSNFLPTLSSTTLFSLSVFNPDNAPLSAYPIIPADVCAIMYVSHENANDKLYYFEALDSGFLYKEWRLLEEALFSQVYAVSNGSLTSGYTGAGGGRQVPFCNGTDLKSGSNDATNGWVTFGAQNKVIIKPVTVAPWEKRRIAGGTG